MALPVSLNSSITAYNFTGVTCLGTPVNANGVYAKANAYYDGPQGLPGTDYANGTPQDGASMIIFHSAGGAPPPFNVWYINLYCDNNYVYAHHPSTDATNIPETGWRLGNPGESGEVIPLVLSGIRADADPYAPWGGLQNWLRLRLLEYV
jgi:hypothetical protein